MTFLTIAREDPGQPQVMAALSASDAWYARTYPAESNHLLDIWALRQRSVEFVVARHKGVFVGFGAVVNHRAFGEIKRMYVVPAWRHAGAGAQILGFLEQLAREAGLAILRLETGIRQPSALALYRKNGYSEIAPFGNYKADPNSRFFEKQL